MAWIFLATAIVFEIVATSQLKATDGFTRVIPTLTVVGGYGVAFYMLSLALRTLQLGVAYAIWAGAGTALVAAIGIVLLGEPLTAVKVVGVGLIAAGVVVLNLGGAAH